MTITCVTTRYLPNLRHLIRLAEVDRWVVLDLAQLPHRNRDSFVTRNRIQHKSSGNEIWLSVPILRASGEVIREAKIDPTDFRWVQKHIGRIRQTYLQRDRLAEEYVKGLAQCLTDHKTFLLDVNLSTLELTRSSLSLEIAPPILESAILDNHSKDHRLEISRILGANKYVAGRVEWMVMQRLGELERFAAEGITVSQCVEFPQLQFDHNIIERFSVVHSICEDGLETTLDLLRRTISFARSTPY